MGPASQPCQRIALQGCTDGFQAFACGSGGMDPVEYVILSLPPALRFKPEFMLLHMLLPKASTKKYYDFAAEYELNGLFNRGKSAAHSFITIMHKN